MILTLEITGPEAAKLGPERRKVFDAAGGSIGRHADCAWVLQDPYVSGRHALIRYVNGVFYVEDTRSRNGVFINAPANRLEDGKAHALKPGDRILIEPYEIRVSIASAPQDVKPSRPELAAAGSRGVVIPAADPFALDDPFNAPLAPVARPTPSSFPSDVSRGESSDLAGGHSPLLPVHDVDPMNLLGFDAPAPPPPDVPRSEHLAANSLLSDHYEAPPVPPSPGRGAPHGAMIPADYNPLGTDESQVIRSVPSRPPTPRPAPARQRSPAKESVAPPVTSGDGALADVLAGAGLTGVPVTPELARNFGEILQVVVSGVMDVLQARQRIKDEFRIRVTTFKRADNNPLKFSANVEDALHNLLVKRNAAYLAPVEAFEDAFDDLRNHQIAMLAGLRAAFEAMLAEFDPDRLQQEFDRQLKKGSPLLAAPSKLRYWDLYREKVNEMGKDAEASFRRLFGDEFAKEYEQQLERLKAQHRVGPR
jgi:type VI secretion system FHA domain protein